MNLDNLFQMQKVLDEHIEKEHPRAVGEDRLGKKILSFQVELGELANELPEVFKFWSNKKNNYEKALKELVDCFHFTLSIGLELFTDKELKRHGYFEFIASNFIVPLREYRNQIFIKEDIKALFGLAHSLSANPTKNRYMFSALLTKIILIGVTLGFSYEQIINGYLDKNKVNHKRQEAGY